MALEARNLGHAAFGPRCTVAAKGSTQPIWASESFDHPRPVLGERPLRTHTQSTGHRRRMRNSPLERPKVKAKTKPAAEDPPRSSMENPDIKQDVRAAVL